MSNHAAEKHRIEPWEWTIEASDKTPADGKEGVTRIVDFAGFSI
jgi:hypothetical protein